MDFFRPRITYLPLIVAITLWLTSCNSSEQVRQPVSVEKDKPKVVVEKQAAIIGGQQALQEKLRYPEEARKKGIETVIQANVLVNKNGKIEQVTFDSETEYDFEEAAENALYQVKFKPGERNGQPVRMFVTIPVIFKL